MTDQPVTLDEIYTYITVTLLGGTKSGDNTLGKVLIAMGQAIAAGGGGSGWPTVNGSGAGNLAAETGSGDTVGYNFTDDGIGGFNVTSASGGFEVVTTGGAFLTDNGTAGLGLIANGSGGITIDKKGTGGLVIETTGGGVTTGIDLSTQASDTGGITLTDHGSGGVKIQGVTYFVGSGSPLSVVTPKAKGDLYVDDTTPALWQATGTANTDWQQVGTSVQTPTTAALAIAVTQASGRYVYTAAGLAYGVLDGGAQTGEVQGSLMIPVQKFGAGISPFTISDDPEIVAIPTSADALDGGVTLYVQDLAGVNSLTVNGSASTTPGDSTLTLPLKAATATVTGTDLSYVGGVVTTTAGGTYSAILTLSGTWD